MHSSMLFTTKLFLTWKAKELDTTKQNKNLWAYPLYGSYYFVKGPQAPETKALAADAGYEE